MIHQARTQINIYIMENTDFKTNHSLKLVLSRKTQPSQEQARQFSPVPHHLCLSAEDQSAATPVTPSQDYTTGGTIRLDRAGIVYVTDLVRGALESPSGRSGAISPEMKILITLRSLATGKMQLCDRDHLGPSLLSSAGP